MLTGDPFNLTTQVAMSHCLMAGETPAINQERVQLMDKDEKFIARWKPIHEKTIVKYVIIGSFINLLILSLLTLIAF